MKSVPVGQRDAGIWQADGLVAPLSSPEGGGSRGYSK
jgi:hypothetical protein